KEMLGAWGKVRAEEPLTGALRRAGEQHHIVAAIVRPEFLRKGAPPMKEFAPLLELQSAVVTIDDAVGGGLDATLTYADADKAKSAHQAAQAALDMAKQMFPKLEQEVDADKGPLREVQAKIVPKLKAMLDSAKVEQQ